jgi:hypothetical protein
MYIRTCNRNESVNKQIQIQNLGKMRKLIIIGSLLTPLEEIRFSETADVLSKNILEIQNVMLVKIVQILEPHTVQAYLKLLHFCKCNKGLSLTLLLFTFVLLVTLFLIPSAVDAFGLT